jgi:hypothetical protein
MICNPPFFTCRPQKEDLRSLTEDEADDVMKGAPVSPVFSPQRPQLTEVKQGDADFLPPHLLKLEFIKYITFVTGSIFHYLALFVRPKLGIIFSLLASTVSQNLLCGNTNRNFLK